MTDIDRTSIIISSYRRKPVSRRLNACVLSACLLISAAAPAFARTAPGTEARSVSISLDGSLDNNGDSRTAGLRAGAMLDFASELKLGSSALEWNLEAYFDYSRSETPGYESTAKSLGLDLTRIALSRLGEKEPDIFKPYLLTGLQLSWLKETTEDDEGTSSSSSSRFLSPVVGGGVEWKLSGRTGLNLEYRSNLAGGGRRISGLTLGVSYALFGAEEQEEGAAGADKED